jgi:hypothetical protein
MTLLKKENFKLPDWVLVLSLKPALNKNILVSCVVKTERRPIHDGQSLNFLVSVALLPDFLEANDLQDANLYKVTMFPEKV